MAQDRKPPQAHSDSPGRAGRHRDPPGPQASPPDAPHPLPPESHDHAPEAPQESEARRRDPASMEISAQRYRAFFDYAPVGFLTLDKAGLIREANLNAGRQLGVARRLLIGQDFSRLVEPEDLDCFRLCLWQVFTASGQERCEVRLKRQDGEWFYARLECRSLEDVDGEPLCYTSISDISELKQTEARLRESQWLFASFMEHLPSVAIIQDLEGRYLFVNPAMEQAFDTTREDWLGKTMEDRWPPEVVEKFKAQDRLVLETGKPVRALDTLRHPDGLRQWSYFIFPIVDHEGRPVMIGTTAIDVTEHLATKQRLEQLLAASPAYIFTMAPGGDFPITYISENVQAAMGWEVQDYQQDPHFWFNHVHPEDQARVMELLQTPWENDHIISELRFLSRDHGYRWVHTEAKLLRDPDGAPVEIVGAWIDITARKEMEQELKAANRNLQDLIQAMPLPIIALDQDGRVTAWNAAAQRTFGWTAAEVLGSPNPIIPPGREPEFHQLIARQMAGESLAGVELVRRRQDGSLLDVKLSCGPHYDAQGQIAGVIAVLEDITAAKRVMKDLAESEARFRASFDQAPIGAAIVSLDYRFIRVNAELCRLTGYSEAELISLTFVEITHPADVAPDVTQASRLFRGEIDSYQMDKRYIRKDGETVWVRLSVRLVRNAGGEPLYFLPTVEDITARRQVEEALKESAAQYRLLVNQIPAMVFKGYADGSVDFFDNKVEALTGYSKAEFDDRRLAWSDLILPEDRGRVSQAFVAALKADLAYEREYRIRRKNGEVVWIQAMGQIFCDAGGRVDYVSGVLFDITARKTAETILNQERHRFFSLLDLLPAYVWLLAPDYTISFANRVFKEVFGEPGTQKCYELFRGRQTPCEICPNLKVLETGKPANWEWTNSQGKTYQIYNYYFDAFDDTPMVLELGVDITAHKALEAQLLHSQKMEAVGRLAGGVAHDFNNLLMAIMGYGELLRAGLNQDDPLYKYSEHILRASERGASLTQQLLAFSRRQVTQRQVFTLSLVVADVEKMLNRVIGEDIDLHLAASPEPGLVNADPGQIAQVIMNLGVNARDAMPTGGLLSLETATIDFAQPHQLHSEVIPPGPYVRLTVRDTGSGMDAETQNRIFEPFFTTKEVGKGSGLGLSMVYGIVKQNGGYIEVESQPGQGTTFTVYLPRVEGVAEAPREAAVAAANLEGSETILLVEDEDALRKLLARFLRLYGYQVLEARNGGEAILACEGHQGPIHLMVTDVVMPQMSGEELAARLTRQHPDLKVFFMSGYTDCDLTPYGVPDEAQPFLAKPFRPMDLVEKVRILLDASGSD
jgi:two-component system, cell cycle sensor histidine kinase and response regulator CckA